MSDKKVDRVIDNAIEGAEVARQQWETHGESIGQSRWFEGVPNVKLEGREVVWKCPISGCEGNMVFTGMVWATGSPGYHHQCDTCGFTAAIHGAVFGDLSEF